MQKTINDLNNQEQDTLVDKARQQLDDAYR